MHVFEAQREVPVEECVGVVSSDRVVHEQHDAGDGGGPGVGADLAEDEAVLDVDEQTHEDELHGYWLALR